MPGGLPKLELRRFLTETRWGRCAILTEAAHSELSTFPWAWSPAVHVVCAPGVQSFVAGLEYTHGGLSLQECRIPELHIRGAEVPISVRILSVKWINLRCRVTLEGDFTNTRVDLRLRPADPSSTVVESPRPPDSAGIASLVLARDELVGDSASAVVLEQEQRVRLGYLDDLRARFPGLHVVHLHRDPVETIASGASLNATLHAMHADTVDLHRIGAEWIERMGWTNDRALAHPRGLGRRPVAGHGPASSPRPSPTRSARCRGCTTPSGST